jgi:hypothetical protein
MIGESAAKARILIGVILFFEGDLMTQTKRTLFVSMIAVLALAGCSSSMKGPERTAKASDGIGVVKTEISKGITQIDATTAALNDLAGAPKADLTPQYKHFAKQVESLDSMAKKVAARSQSMKAKAKDYFDNWEKEAATIKSSSIRQISDERRAIARASFDRMGSELAKGKAAFTPLMDELHDIQLYLSNDLTSAGVTACKPIADEANANAARVKEALNNVIAELDKVQNELSPKEVAK